MLLYFVVSTILLPRELSLTLAVFCELWKVRSDSSQPVGANDNPLVVFIGANHYFFISQL